MMEAGKGLWSLIQDQILGMKWLKDAVGAGLTAMGRWESLDFHKSLLMRQRTFFYL